MRASSPLRRTALFKQLDDVESSALEGVASLRRLDRGEAVFSEGEPATGLYVLLSGRIKICRDTPEGKTYVLHFVTPGQLFAEAAAFELGEFPASAIALEPAEVAYFPRAEFIELIREHPTISLKVISGLSRWIREFLDKIEELTTKDVSARLARFLLEAAGEGSGNVVELAVTKAELAASLGTVGETLSRSFRRFRDEGVLEVEGSRIRILEPESLERAARGL